MKNTQLIQIPKAELVRFGSKPSKKSNSATEGFKKKEDFINKFLEVYEKQMERIHKLMLMNDTLQKENEELKRNQKLIDENVPDKKPKVEKEKRLEAISYNKLKELSNYLYEIFGRHVGRVKYRDGLVHILYTLYQLKGEASPEQLFASADLIEVTGFRYTGFLKKARFVNYSPTTKKGYYVLTDLGKQFVNGKLTNEKEFCNAIGIVNINLWK